MNSVVKREHSTFADLFDWLETEVPTLGVFRPYTGQVLRVEDFLDEGQYLLRTELPGIDPDKDVEISIAGGVLTVKAERREETKEAQRSEFRYGTFTRSVKLPAGADLDDVKAGYKDGILEVRVGIAKASTPEPKHITISKD